MTRAGDRVRQQSGELRHQQRRAAERPNEPPEDRTTIPAADYCPTSRTGRHDFSKFFNDDPTGSGLRSGRCWYCEKYSPRSQARIDAWRAEQPK